MEETGEQEHQVQRDGAHHARPEMVVGHIGVRRLGYEHKGAHHTQEEPYSVRDAVEDLFEYEVDIRLDGHTAQATGASEGVDE